MNVNIEIEDTEIKQLIKTRIISGFKHNSKFFIANAVRDVLSDLFAGMDKKEFKAFLLCGLVEYLEKYSYKDIDKLIKEIRIKQ